ncbi:MAG: carbohydrate binding domain-containing protein [Saprospiraceae bacterium]|nr:carbohydrate binding domain-containing protein [Pyrinomonadaceae bacterium]
MSLKILKIDSKGKRIGLAAFASVFLIGALFAAKWGFAHTAARNADMPEVADFAISLGPDDPQTHYTAAVLLEKTFVPEDQARSLAEYEKAAALSPNNYLLWLELGRARERIGDQIGAESALRKALELAPNYSRVQWTLGNVLLRQGKMDEGFAEIRRAVAVDTAYTNAAAGTAWLLLDGDMAAVRAAIGDSTRLNAALAALLAEQKRFDESFEIWSSLPADEKPTILKDLGNVLQTRMFEAKKYRYSRTITGQIGLSDNPASLISNGGFEIALKMQNPGVFEWQIGTGTNPRIGQTDGQKYSGTYSLLVSFGNGGREFRTISQILAVKPGESYGLAFFYRSDVKTGAVFKWEIANAVDGKTLSATAPLSNNTEWVGIRTNFTGPQDSDGVIIRLVRENCETSACSVTGNLWFDDFGLELK